MGASYLSLMKIKSSLHLKDVINLFSGTFIYAGSSVLNNIILARNLEKSDFGRFNAINSTVALFSLFVLFGLNISSVRVISKFKKNNPYFIKYTIARFKYFYRVSIIVICLIYAVSIPFISNLFFNDKSLIFPFYFSLIYLFSFSYSELVTGFLSGLGEFILLRNLNYFKALFTLSLMLFSFITNNFLTIYILFAISNLVLVYLSNRALNRVVFINYNQINQNLPVRYNKKIIAYSSYIFLGGIVVLPFTYVSNIVLSSGIGIQMFAILSVFSTWQGVLTFFPVTYSKIVLPFISGNKTVQSRINKFALATRINNISVYFIYLFLMFSTLFILNLYGENYVIYSKLFGLFLGSTAIAFLGNTYGAQVQVKGFRYTIIFGNLIVGVSILFFSFLLHKEIGLLSLCLGMLVGYCLGFFVSFFTIIIKDNFPMILHIYVLITFLIMLSLVLINYFINTYFLYSSIISIVILFLIDKRLKKQLVKL
jgi:O-antigen/teichoic acid export membrane protein